MLIVTVNFKAKADKIEEFHEAILDQAQSSRRDEPGCLRFDVAVQPEDPSRFFVYEIYDNEAAFEEHKNSAHSARTRVAVANLLEERELTVWQLLDS